MDFTLEDWEELDLDLDQRDLFWDLLLLSKHHLDPSHPQDPVIGCTVHRTAPCDRGSSSPEHGQCWASGTRSGPCWLLASPPFPACDWSLSLGSRVRRPGLPSSLPTQLSPHSPSRGSHVVSLAVSSGTGARGAETSDERVHSLPDEHWEAREVCGGAFLLAVSWQTMTWRLISYGSLAFNLGLFPTSSSYNSN